SAEVSPEIAWVRAGGRRHYNAQRRLRKQMRRAHIIARTIGIDRDAYGLGVALARVFGVSPSTISRDLWAIRNWRSGGLLRVKGCKVIAQGGGEALFRRAKTAETPQAEGWPPAPGVPQPPAPRPRPVLGLVRGRRAVFDFPPAQKCATVFQTRGQR